MILLVVQTIVNFLVGLLVAITTLRHKRNGRLTWNGKIVIGLSIVGVVVSLFDLGRQKAEEERARYRLADADIELEVTAVMIGEAPSDALARSTPSSMQINITIPNGGGWSCTLEASPDFMESGYSRGGPSATRVYRKGTCRAMGTSVYAYLWDLDGKDLLILRDPRYLFSGVFAGRSSKEWDVRVELRIRGHFIEGKPSGQGLRFEVRNFSRQALGAEL